MSNDVPEKAVSQTLLNPLIRFFFRLLSNKILRILSLFSLLSFYVGVMLYGCVTNNI